ncbi:hypothetical protein NEPTK9_001811 [Candidatus Neptunochlamydia vexilliferae]|uniref:Uncharacterized protein n=4 Tax=Candidatus Neptunichlamydia vexilliferae TaxID=1651774 RepID=A0ABS0AWT0_9BACT|nr:hypothetical protein [Candidatus Neptunochlamydia vexilliferae]MBF5058554.1 hypothetical protein [Candidatus Neptunochlamydia vexilliferae]MBF5058583.1 hypothetical protein [Candidatus Neptunochlamydia vexilliferae]MBF5059258.1 hypothetical protein [Candidatus Neptunochlamydia vexilliferae]MBF5059939.1 hypothetical protein [Candidatus Neptunochlamydia vexilliferae]
MSVQWIFFVKLKVEQSEYGKWLKTWKKRGLFLGERCARFSRKEPFQRTDMASEPKAKKSHAVSCPRLQNGSAKSPRTRGGTVLCTAPRGGSIWLARLKLKGAAGGLPPTHLS